MASVAIPPAFRWPLQFCLFSTITSYILSLITSNVSQVDRVWTFLPTIYTAYFALIPLWPQQQPFPLCPYTPKELVTQVSIDYSPRALLMLGLVVVWMFRLSYNTHRRGLFNLRDEDYRWAVLRKQIPPWFFQLTNITFIATIQNILLFLLGYPTSVASIMQPHTPLAPSDFFLASLALVILALEFTADNQQYAFQTYKVSVLSNGAKYDEKKQWPGARLKWTPGDAKRGFVTRGLWAYSRHPNFACEQTFWWVINLIPLLSPPPPTLPSFPLSTISRFISSLPSFLVTIPTLISPPNIHQTLTTFIVPFAPLLPALCLSLLFFSSTCFTESITISKYPKAYHAYRERVGMFSCARTWMKGLALGWAGRRTKVEELIWGKEGKDE